MLIYKQVRQREYKKHDLYLTIETNSLASFFKIDNGPVWHWFLLNILPLENDLQYRFLTKTSLKDRLKQIKRIVQVLLTPHASRPIVNSNSKDSISNNSAASHYTTTNNNNNNMTNTVTNTTSLNDVANTDTYTTSNEDTPENQNQL